MPTRTETHDDGMKLRKLHIKCTCWVRLKSDYEANVNAAIFAERTSAMPATVDCNALLDKIARQMLTDGEFKLITIRR